MAAPSAVAGSSDPQQEVSSQGPDGAERAAPLRVALLVDGYEQPRWVAELIETLLRSPAVQIVLVVRGATAPIADEPRRGRIARLWANRRHLLYALYRRWDERRFRPDEDLFSEVDTSPLVGQLPCVEPRVRRTRFCDWFDDGSVDEILAHRVDVAIRFGFRILKGRALSIARYGVWSYHHGDNLVNRGGPAGFWEVVEGHRTTGAILQVLTEELDAGRVIHRSFVASNPLSVAKNRALYYRSASAILPRKLEELWRVGRAALADRSGLSDDWRAYAERLYVMPTNGELLPHLVRLLAKMVKRRVEAALRVEQWFFAYHVAPTASAGDAPNPTLYRYTRMIPPSDRIWADPFPVRTGDGVVLFFEEKIADGNGRIAAMTIDADARRSEPRVVLERPYHLSYPFVFEWNGSWWMIPETAAAGRVELYRATEFPWSWSFERTLLEDVNAADATLLERDGRWWMFVAISPPGMYPWDELHLYYADTPLGPWSPHRANPVKSDVRGARPAGRLFEWQGRLYRPGQDCAERYGHMTVVHRVDELSIDRYRESEVSRIAPRWAPRLLATHTLNAHAGASAIDGKRWRWRWDR